MKGEVLSLSDIANIIDPDFRLGNKKHLNEIYKMIYRLRSNDYIFPIRNSLYFVNYQEHLSLNDIFDNNYWAIAKKIIKDEAGDIYFIGGNKSLEFHLKDNSFQDKLIVYTKDIQKNVTINGRKKIFFKKAGGKKQFPFSSINKFKTIAMIDGVKLNIADKELSLLDSLLVNDKSGIDEYLLRKFLTKYAKELSRESLGKLVKLKYITGINRLRHYSKKLGYNDLYEIALDVIKKEGANCFLTIKE